MTEITTFRVMARTEASTACVHVGQREECELIAHKLPGKPLTTSTTREGAQVIIGVVLEAWAEAL
jgi:hypothetical protein